MILYLKILPFENIKNHNKKRKKKKGKKGRKKERKTIKLYKITSFHPIFLFCYIKFKRSMTLH